MSGKIQMRLAVFAALAALVAVLVPSGLAFGSHDSNDPVVGGDPTVISLTLGKQDKVTWEGQTQSISTRKNDCTAVAFAASPQLLDVTAIGGVLGEVKDGIGVKSASDGSGEPCGRIEAEDNEAVSVALGSALAGDYLMTAIDVDLELKFNAAVDIQFKHKDSIVTTVNFNPMAGSDDGPDSGDGDNYRFNSETFGVTGILFDEVVFKPTAGAISLEGGADGTVNGLLTANNSSQFQVMKVFDGDITCGEEVDVDDGGVGLVTLHAINLGEGWDAICTDRKFYNDSLSESELVFLPEFAAQGRYTVVITLEGQTITSDGSGVVTSLQMQYSATGDFSDIKALEACEGQPITDPESAGYQTYWEQPSLGLLPSTSETACYYSLELIPTGGGNGTEVWGIYFEDDPGFRF